MKYCIWSWEHEAWWAPDGQGYTPSIAEAGRYDFDDAARYTVGHVPAGEEIAMCEADALRGPPPAYGPSNARLASSVAAAEDQRRVAASRDAYLVIRDMERLVLQSIGARRLLAQEAVRRTIQACEAASGYGFGRPAPWDIDALALALEAVDA